MSNAANFEIALRGFVAKVQALLVEHYKQYQHVKPPTITCEPGRRYIRVVQNRVVQNNSNGTRYVYCFIDITNGDVLKAASWKAPAKHARGNIFAPNAMDAVTAYGAVYLR
jgi:hypothetical protein